MPEKQSASLLDALIPTVTLMILLALSVYLFGEDSSYGANQIALSIAAGVAALIGLKNGLPWRQLEQAIYDGIGISMAAILILLSVGTLIGCWILSGTVPTMIYYGLMLLDPSWFYPAACILCALVALSIGSSWTVAGTLGIGLIGTAAGLGLSIEITAGAIISGAYFGDKLSPLSDTTNLASAVTSTDLFSHIKHMAWTTGPSIIIAIVGFFILGFNGPDSGGDEQMSSMMLKLQQHFAISPLLLVPLLVVLVLAWRKVPALPSILAGVVVGGIFAVIFQRPTIIAFASSEQLSPTMSVIKGLWSALFDGYQATTGNTTLDSLLSRGGMSSMLNTVWLIITAMVFGAVMEKAGLLLRLMHSILSMVSSTGGLITSTLLTSFGTNIIMADQYISVVLPGRMYQLEFKRRGLASKNLSRSLEDGGTITSVLIPWNTCGAYMAATLGIATLAYLPYCLFNIINPFIAALYGYLNFKITPLEEHQPKDTVAA